MTGPVTPWAERARNEWAVLEPVDELRPPETDEEPWDEPEPDQHGDLLAFAEVAIVVWGAAVAATVVVLAAVLALFGIGKVAGR